MQRSIPLPVTSTEPKASGLRCYILRKNLKEKIKNVQKIEHSEGLIFMYKKSVDVAALEEELTKLVL